MCIGIMQYVVFCILCCPRESFDFQDFQDSSMLVL